MKEISKGEQAEQLFKEGYNCSQSLALAFCEEIGIEKSKLLRIVSSFGGGMGRMREVCGAVSSMALLAGLKQGNIDPSNEEGKESIYLLTRQLAQRFKEKHGTIICRELLGIKDMEESARPSARTKEYYASRPCSRLVATAGEIIEEMLLEETE